MQSYSFLLHSLNVQDAKKDRDDAIGIHDVINQALALFSLEKVFQEQQTNDTRHYKVCIMDNCFGQSHSLIPIPFLGQEHKPFRLDQHDQCQQAKHQARQEYLLQEGHVTAFIARGLNGQASNNAGRRQAVTDGEPWTMGDDRAF